MFSEYNMAGYQLQNINILEQVSHDSFIQADVNPSQAILLLYRSVEVLQRAFGIFGGIITEKIRDRFNKRFSALLMEMRDNHMGKRTIPIKDYYELKEKILMLTNEYFLVKQRHGINIPVEMARRGEQFVKEVSRSP